MAAASHSFKKTVWRVAIAGVAALLLAMTLVGSAETGGHNTHVWSDTKAPASDGFLPEARQLRLRGPSPPRAPKTVAAAAPVVVQADRPKGDTAPDVDASRPPAVLPQRLNARRDTDTDVARKSAALDQPVQPAQPEAAAKPVVNDTELELVLIKQTERALLHAPLAAAGAAEAATTDVVPCTVEVTGSRAIADHWNACLAAHKDAPFLELCASGATDACDAADLKEAAAAMRPGLGAAQRGAAVVVEPRLALHLGGFDAALRPAAFGLVPDLALRAALHKANAQGSKLSEAHIARWVAAAAGTTETEVLAHGWAALVPAVREVVNVTGGDTVRAVVVAFDRTAAALGMTAEELRARTARCFPLWYLRTKWQPARHHDRLTGLHAMAPFTPYYPGVVSAIETKVALAKVPKAPYDYEALSGERRYEIVFHHPFPEPGSAEEAALRKYQQEQADASKRSVAPASSASPAVSAVAPLTGNGTATTQRDVDAAAVTGAMLKAFVRCVEAGEGLRLRVGPLTENCLVPTQDEEALRKVGPRMTAKILNPPHGWELRSAERFALLLRMGAVFWWRDDRMPGYLTPLTHWDAGLLEHNLAHVDVPVGCGAILLNMDKQGLSDALKKMQRVLRDEQQLPYRFMLHPENVGVSAAWNRLAMFNLAHEPTAQYVWITQPDIFISPTWFSHFDRYMHAHPEFAYVKFFHHASMGVTRKWLLEVGGFFDENVYPSYAEDVELWVRVRASGMPIGDSPVPVRHTHHISSSTLGSDGSARTKIYERWRRENYLWRKWGFDHSRLFTNPSGSDKRQFTKPFNSKVVPFNASWMILDQTHIDCIRNGTGPSYGKSWRHTNGCPRSCLFNMTKIDVRWPGAFDEENQDPMNVKPPGPINSAECF